MLDTRRLLVLREVAAHGSVSGAADALGYTPSAVSQQLGALERETGRALVERHGRGIRLTDAARLLLPHAHDVLAALERADAPGRARARELTGTRPARLVPDRHPRTAARTSWRRCAPATHSCASTSPSSSPTRACPRSRSAASTSPSRTNTT